MIDILGKRYYFFIISLILIVPGMIALIIWGLPLSIDFTGGALLEVKFDSGVAPQPAEIVLLYGELGIEDILAQTTGEDVIIARSSFLDDQTRARVLDALEEEFDTTLTVLRFDSVGPTVGAEVTSRAALAILIAAVAVVIYITWAFRGVEHAFRYGVCAIIAMFHDVAVLISIAALGGHFLGWQINALFLTALLTVIGFSVQDKIVVFDRIRENSNIYRRLQFETLVNHSIVQTLQRSINTQLMTVEFMLLALVLFGGVTLREFALVLLIGLFMGTYSSIFIAAPTLVAWENREWRTWFQRGTKQSAA
jgi:preprotein translocase subunit SecF